MKATITRQIVIDTETTGINSIGTYYEGHNIIEIGAVEIIQRRLTGNNFHIYIKPNRTIDSEAFRIHGISDEFLFEKPTFSEIANKFLDYIYGSELIIHNASFDVGFINYELSQLNWQIPKIDTFCKVTDSLAMARKIFPGKRNSLDALCSRYKINNKERALHGALVDAKLLASVYLAMTGGQTSMKFSVNNNNRKKNDIDIQNIVRNGINLRIILAQDSELIAHESYLDLIQNESNLCLWRS